MRLLPRALAGASTVLLLAACTAQPHEHGTHSTLLWRSERLPGREAPALVVAEPAGSVLVAVDGSADGRRPPRLVRLDGDRAVEVPVRSSSYYARRAQWRGLTTDGTSLHAVGGRSGGAHGNTRWSVWSGRDALVEEPQDFETFGGPRAGGIAGVAASGGAPVLVGSWVDAAGSGLDVAVWVHRGHRWVRRAPVAPDSAADGPDQPSVHGAAADGTGLLMVGSTTGQVDGRIRTRPVVWRAASASGPWRRWSLPGARGVVAEARAASCGGDGDCLVVGTDDGRLTGWRLGSQGTVSSAGLPDRQVIGAAVSVATSGRRRVVALTTGERVRVLVPHRSGWREWPGPRGTLVSLAVSGDRAWVVTSTAGRNRLWSAELP